MFLILNSFMMEALSCRNQSIVSQSKSVDLFLYDMDIRREKITRCIW